MNKAITLLGSTGSIGTQSLDVARMHGYSVFGLAANSSVDKLLEQINEFHPKYVAVVNPDAYAKLSAALAGQADAPKLLQGAGRHGRPRRGAERCRRHRGSTCLAGCH